MIFCEHNITDENGALIRSGEVIAPDRLSKEAQKRLLELGAIRPATKEEVDAVKEAAKAEEAVAKEDDKKEAKK